MNIKNLFFKPLDRSINGVVKADQDDQATVFQEAIKREIALKVDDIIHITGADQDRKPELSAILKEALDDAGNVLAASPEFDVLFEKVGGGDE